MESDRRRVRRFVLPWLRLLPLLAPLLLPACGGDRVAPPGRQGPPRITSVTPEQRSVVSGVVAIHVEAENASAVTATIDRRPIGERRSAPFDFEWNSGMALNGVHSLGVMAHGDSSAVDTTIALLADNPGRGIVVVVEPQEMAVRIGRQFRFTVRVLGSANHEVQWSIRPQGASPPPGDYGTIAADGTYAAPARLPGARTLLISARSVADPTQGDVAIVTLSGSVVEISPASASVEATTSRKFTATVEDGATGQVEWRVEEGIACGYIDSTGLYWAPAVRPDPPQATVRATSRDDPAIFARARIDLTPATIPDEIDRIGRLTSGITNARLLCDQVMGVITWSLGNAWNANDRRIASFGTLRQIPGGFTYDGTTPRDRLVVVPLAGPSFEIVVSRLGAYLGQLDFFATRALESSTFEFVGDFQGRLICPGKWDLEVGHVESPVPDQMILEVADSIRGTLITPVSRSVDLTVGGRGINGTHGIYRDLTIEGSYEADTGDHLEISGGVKLSSGNDFSGPEGTAEDSWSCNFTTTDNLGGDVFQMQLDFAGERVADSPNSSWRVQNPGSWRQAGTVLRNSSPYGGIVLSGPVVAGGPPPWLELRFGERRMILPVQIGRPEPVLVPDPF